MSKMIDASGNTLVNVTESALPTGAATEAKQDTGNTSLASIDGKITEVNTGAVVVSSSALPSGAATAAKQPALGTAGTPSADVITVQGKAAMTPLLTDGSGVTQPVSAASLPLPSGAATSAKQDTAQTALDAIQTAVETIDNPVATISAIPLMRVAVFDDAGAQVTSFGGGAGGTANTEYTKDTASTATDKQIQAGVVRKDTRGSLADTDGDRTQLQVNASGDLRVDGSAVTQPVSDGGGSLTVDGTVAVSGTVTVDGSGVTQPVSLASVPSHPVTNAGTFAVQDSEKVTDNAAFTDGTTKVQPAGFVFDETAGTALTENDAAAARIDSKRAQVLVLEDATTRGRRATVSAGGALLTDASATTQPVSMATNTPVGNVAHDAADSGAPVKVGFRADTTFQTAVADGDRVDALADVYGVQEVRTDHPNKWSYHEDSSSALTDTTVKAAPGAGLSIYVTDIVVSTGAATAFNVFFEEGATKVLGPYYLEAVAGRGLALHFLTPKKITANTALTVTTSAAIAHSIDVTGFIAP